MTTFPTYGPPSTSSRPRLRFPDYGPPSTSSRPRLRFPDYGPPSTSSATRPRLSFGKVLTNAANKLTGFSGRVSDYKTYDQHALDAVNTALSYPQVNTPTVDAGSSVMDALKATAGNILANMGSTGDGEPGVTQVRYPARTAQSAGGLLDSPVVLIGLVLGAGALVYAVNKG